VKEIDAYLKGEERKNKDRPGKADRDGDGKKSETREDKEKSPLNTRRYREIIGEDDQEEGNWASFVLLPEEIKLKMLQEDETVILMARQHPAVLFGKAAIVLGVAIMPFLVMGWSGWQALYPLFLVFIWLFWYLAVLGVGFSFYLLWFYNVYLLTDERVIGMSFPNILQSKVSTADMSDLVDHSVKSNGFWEATWGYGSIEMQTAGEQREFTFEGVPHPDKFNQLLVELLLEKKDYAKEGKKD